MHGSKSDEVREIENKLRRYLSSSELNDLKKIHFDLSDMITYSVGIERDTGDRAIVSYQIQDERIPSENEALKWFANAVEGQIESADVDRQILKHKRVLIKYKN